MTKLTVLAQHFAFPADVISFVAAKTAGKERVPDIVGMGAPIDLHFGKDIGLVNLLNLANGFIDRVPSFLVNLGILL
jgi:hypothetical protein